MKPPPNEAATQPDVRLFDTSAIPDTPEYWEALSNRIRGSATRHRTGIWIARSRASWLSIGALAVAATVVLLLSRQLVQARQSTTTAWLELTPADRVGSSLSARDEPPSVVELLVVAARDAEVAK